MAGEDLKEHVNSTEDFYALLGVEPTAAEAEIRRAYRQTARKYHPDKVGAHNTAALEKFHQLQIAYDVLSDATVKELYDNARRAREEQKARQAAFQGRRKAMIDELEARENGSNKRKREQAEEEATFERELQRLAEDGKRRRLAREEQLRQEILQSEEDERRARKEAQTARSTPVFEDVDHVVAVKFREVAATEHLTRERLNTLFSRFGAVDAVVMKKKRRKPPGEKHKVDYWIALVMFKSIVGAHATIADFEDVKTGEHDFGLIESVEWANGKEPDAVPKGPTLLERMPATVSSNSQVESIAKTGLGAQAPKFSFNAAKHSGKDTTTAGVFDDVLLMRLKNAEKRRLEALKQPEPVKSD